MFKTKCSVVLAALCVTAGCSTKYQVKLDSTPQGAEVVCGKSNHGYTPLTIDFLEDPKEPSYIDASGCSAKWSSGASASYPAHLKVSSGTLTEVMLHRPNVPGYEKDERAAQQIKQKNQEKKFFSETDSTGKNHSSNMLCSDVGGAKTCL